ncbi:MAG: hypothetical protein U9R75_06785 [Candidatus Thermoplasmatota archaeon]|nr:hypothetical protein [Candidatus Thermoplasmatota archaeon]
MDKVKKKWRKKQGTIMFPSTHDITPENLPECIQTIGNILEGGNHLLIVSKPHFRCIADICQSFRQYKDQILFRFTIGSMDSTNCLSFWEPGAPSFEERLGSLTYAFNAGYRTSVSSEPFLDDKVIDLFFKVEPYVTDSVWIGPMNKMEQRVDRTGWDKGSMHYWDLVKGSQTRAEIEIIYGALKDEPHVRWKDAIKDMLGLEKPTEVGMDI